MRKYNLIVVGGGISGVAAAVSAARQGMSVLIIEKSGNFGGAMSNSLVFPFMTFTSKDEEKRLLSDGIFTEMRERFYKFKESSWEFFKFVFDDMITESGVDVLFHSTVFSAKTTDRKVEQISVATKTGVLEFEADFFIDTTGDGELIFMTGCDYQLGRESDNLCQPMTTCFRLGNVDVEMFRADRPRLFEVYNEYQKAGKIKNPRENILAFVGLGKDILHLNTTRIIKHNPVDAFEITKAEIEARRQVLEMFEFLKENSKACENAEIISIANHIGVRESRKLKGVHVLTANELKDSVDFEDSIAIGNYEIDIHNPTGTGTTIYSFDDGRYYRIPYRSLLPKEYDNMLVAGRCISAEHEAHSAVRIMPICACLGEAAGVAVAVAKKTGTNTHTVDIKAVREKLKELGAAID